MKAVVLLLTLMLSGCAYQRTGVYCYDPYTIGCW